MKMYVAQQFSCIIKTKNYNISQCLIKSTYNVSAKPDTNKHGAEKC